MEAILDIKQGNTDVQTYLTRFQKLAAKADWPDSAQQTIYRRGLQDEIKDELARVSRPASFQELVTLSLQIESRLLERRSERRRNRGFSQPTPTPLPRVNPATDEPMQIGAARGPLTQVERRRRREAGLCMYCGSSNHLLRECTEVPPRRQGNFHPRSMAREVSGEATSTLAATQEQ